MWSNITGVVSQTISKVQKFQNEIEQQLNEAVQVDNQNTKGGRSIVIDGIVIEQSDSTPTTYLQSSDIAATVNASSTSESVPTLSTVVDVVDSSNATATSTAAAEVNARNEKMITELLTDVDLRRRKVDELTGIIIELKDQIACKSRAIEECEQRRSIQATTINEMKAEMETKANAVEDLTVKLEQQSIEYKQLLSTSITANSATTSHAATDDDVNQLANHIKELEQKLQTQKVNSKKVIDKIKLDLGKNKEEKDSIIKDLEATIVQLSSSANSNASINDDSISKIASSELTISQLNTDITKLKEIIVQRERALETSITNTSETNLMVEKLHLHIQQLQQEVESKDVTIKANQAASSSSADATVAVNELKKQCVKLQEQIADRDGKLEAYEAEGKILAKKQGEMEKVVRKTRAEMKEKDVDINKLKESKEQLIKAMEEMQEQVKKHEMEATNAVKSLAAMQAVSVASSDKLSKIEQEMMVKSDEVIAQKRVLDASWSENNELKRTVAELKADRDDLKRQLGEGTSKVMETESVRRDTEQREAVLRATNKQLQDSLQRHMQESTRREEKLHDEVNDMRKRWNEAVSSRDSLALELSNATTPLLRQIAALQDSVRIKAEQWQSLEISLTEKALKAESMGELAEHKKGLLEDQVSSLKQQYTSILHKYNEAQTLLLDNEAMLEKLNRKNSHTMERSQELQTQLDAEIKAKKQCQEALRDVEVRHQMEVHECADDLAACIKRYEQRIAQLTNEVTMLQDKIVSYSDSKGTDASADSSSRVGNSHASSSSSDGNGDSYSSKATSYHRNSMVTLSGNHSNSYVGTERLQKGIQQKEDEINALSLQIKQLQDSRNALLDEVSYLSSRNAQLEDMTASVPVLQNDNTMLQDKVDVLLTMLGEKEEELEAASADMKEVKYLYRSQIEELIKLRIQDQS